MGWKQTWQRKPVCFYTTIELELFLEWKWKVLKIIGSITGYWTKPSKDLYEKAKRSRSNLKICGYKLVKKFPKNLGFEGAISKITKKNTKLIMEDMVDI